MVLGDEVKRPCMLPDVLDDGSGMSMMGEKGLQHMQET